MRFRDFLRTSGKKAVKLAFWIAVGTAIGGVLLPRLLFSENFNSTYPPLLLHLLMYAGVGFAASFLVQMLIDGIGLLLKKKR